METTVVLNLTPVKVNRDNPFVPKSRAGHYLVWCLGVPAIIVIIITTTTTVPPPQGVTLPRPEARALLPL
jgi:hypothetical protein